MKKEIDKFMEEYYDNYLKRLTQKQFEEDIDKWGYNIGGQPDANWSLISDGSYDFRRFAREVNTHSNPFIYPCFHEISHLIIHDGLRKQDEVKGKLKVQEVRDFYKKYLLPDEDSGSIMRKLCLQVI